MNLKSKTLTLSLLALAGSTAIIVLYNLSENITHYHNKCNRRYPQHAAQEVYSTDLKFNSYYFAGSRNGKIYLGNYTAPLQILELDSKLQTKKIFRIKLNDHNLPFNGPQIRILNTNFYVFEGSAPYVFMGSTNNWEAKLKIKKGTRFSHLMPIDSLNMVVRFISPKGGENILGSLNLENNARSTYNPSLLQKQFDGVFDTDGVLLFNKSLNRIVYVYRYRNEFVVATPKLKLDYRGNTIDTVTKANIQLTTIKNSNLKTFAQPPLVVNKTSAVSGNLLFVNSELPGQYDSEHLWKTAAIIDVYDLTNKTYRSSFPIYNIGTTKVRSFIVEGNRLYALIGESVVCYKLKEFINQNKAASHNSK